MSIMACGSGAVAKLPLPLHGLSRTSVGGARVKLNAATAPPAFLAPQIHAQSFSLQSSCLATAPRTSSNSAQNLRGALRRIGQSSKWSSSPPTASLGAAPHEKTPPVSPFKRITSKRESPRSDRTRPPDRQGSGRRRDQEHSFRLRAKALLEDLHTAIRDLGGQTKASPASLAQNDAAVSKALSHFEGEMKALRVMIKSKDVLADPDNAWKSASRIKAPYNAAIRLCMQTDKYERAHKLLNQMKKDGIFPNAATYNVVINGLTRSLVMQTNSAPPERKAEGLLERKEAQRIREAYQELEKLWKQAFPRYFQRAGAPRSKDALLLDKDDFHSMTEQARRNLVSQQASIHEAREFPKVLTNAVGAYANFLRYIGSKEEIDQLFERLFPSNLLDSMAKGLMPDASPQDKLESVNRKLSDWLPLGDKTIISVFLVTVRETDDANRLAMVERVWTRLQQLMDLERFELLSASSTFDKKHKTKTKHRVDSASSDSDAPRFVPDDQLMVNLFSRLKPQPDVDPTRELGLALSIVNKIYALDLKASADTIIRDPQTRHKAEALDYKHYLRRDANAIDGLGAPVAELRDPTVASAVFRLLSSAEAWTMYVALFNYLWARSHAEHADAGLEASHVASVASETVVFGSTLQPTFAVSLLWYLAKVGDPVGARVVLDAMNRASEAALDQRFDRQHAVDRRARRAKSNACLSARTASALEWRPSVVCYARAMRANLTAVFKQPQGLTAATLQGKYDAWIEAKALFAEWSELKEAGRSKQGIRHSNLTRIHADTLRSLLLNIARSCAMQQGDQGIEVAREALRILEERVGLERIVEETKQLQRDIEHGGKEDAALRGGKSYTLGCLSKVLNLALDTTQQSFAPKADVELWKRVKRMIPASSASDDSEFKPSSQQKPWEPRSAGTEREVRARRAGGNRLLLSKDDHLELEAGAELEDEEAFDQGDAEEFRPRSGSYRMQRRSRHVEQELERWVRGASV